MKLKVVVVVVGGGGVGVGLGVVIGGVVFVVMKRKGGGVVELKKMSVMSGVKGNDDGDLGVKKKWNWKKWKKGVCDVGVEEVVEEGNNLYEFDVVVVIFFKWEIVKFLSFFDKVCLEEFEFGLECF